MGETRRLYYRLDVAIDAVAMRSPGNRTTTAPEELESGAPPDADERAELEAVESSPDDGGAPDSEAMPEATWTPLDRARILDISGSGLQLQARSTELGLGDRVVVAFPFGGQNYRLATEVMWARRSQFGGATRVGLRFDGMTEREREALVREIYRAQRSAGKLRRR